MFVFRYDKYLPEVKGPPPSPPRHLLDGDEPELARACSIM